MLYKNILLVDDDPDDAEIFMEAVGFVNEKIIMRHIDNPVKAFQELETLENLPDLIFLDYNMPLMNGKEFLEQIKSKGILRSIPVILISTPSEEFVFNLLEKGEIIRYMSKPSSYNELIRMLKEVIV
ncbi:response regulator [Flavobacterium chungangensis]|uniref:Response regulator n=1 Tax=Flavobacterium chungangensis TaxID=2708132 RepID=A0ABV8ZFR3_9FLAO